MCYDEWYVGAPCNGTDYGNGCNTEITGYHFRGVFSGWACWWHTRNQAWNTSTSSNHYQLAQQFGLEASQGWCNWCFASGDVPTGMSQGGCGYLSSSNVGAWGWCAESVSDRGGWICFPDAGHPTCSGATSFPSFP